MNIYLENNELPTEVFVGERNSGCRFNPAKFDVIGYDDGMYL